MPIATNPSVLTDRELSILKELSKKHAELKNLPGKSAAEINLSGCKIHVMSALSEYGQSKKPPVYYHSLLPKEEIAKVTASAIASYIANEKNAFYTAYKTDLEQILLKFHRQAQNLSAWLSPYIKQNKITLDSLESLATFITTDTSLPEHKKNTLYARLPKATNEIKKQLTTTILAKAIENFLTAEENGKQSKYYALIRTLYGHDDENKAKIAVKNIARLANNELVDLPALITAIEAYHKKNPVLKIGEETLISENQYQYAIRILDDAQQHAEGKYVDPLIDMIQAIKDILPLGEVLTGVAGKNPTEFDKMQTIINTFGESPTSQNVRTVYWQPIFEQCLENKQLEEKEKTRYTFFRDKHFTGRHDYTTDMYKILKALGSAPTDSAVKTATKALIDLKAKIDALPKISYSYPADQQLPTWPITLGKAVATIAKKLKI